MGTYKKNRSFNPRAYTSKPPQVRVMVIEKSLYKDINKNSNCQELLLKYGK